jgi:hypothetical protein
MPAHFASTHGRSGAKNSKFIALAFSPATTPTSLRPFVVISCVAEGSIGAPLCFSGSVMRRES